MQTLKVLGDLLPILGTVGLLGLWLYQQTGVEERSSELQRLTTATSVYQTYQSHNALFNAVNELTGKDAKATEQLRTFQIYNYELGLRAIEDVLPESSRKGIPVAMNAYGSEGFAEKMDRTQKRLELLQERLAEAKEKTRKSVESARRRYLLWYVALSALSVLGAVCKITTTLAPQGR
jgi:hypothetical protein